MLYSFMQKHDLLSRVWNGVQASLVVIGRQSGRKSTQASIGAWMSRGIGPEQLGLCGYEDLHA